MKRALIFGGGEYGKEFPVISSEDLIIAADKGCEILAGHSIEPDVTIGDFDSASYIPANAIVLPVEKDITDTHAAVNAALEKECDEIHIYGGMGGRIDHTFANYTLLTFLAEKGIKGYLYGENYTVTSVRNGKIVLSGKKGRTISVFSWNEKAEGVTLKGLYYPLENVTLTNTFALGVSNSFVENEAEISVKEGTLLIMIEN